MRMDALLSAMNAMKVIKLGDVQAPGEIFLKPDSTVKCFDSSIYYYVLILIGSLGMCSRKNKREVVFAKRRIGTAYSLVAVHTY